MSRHPDIEQIRQACGDPGPARTGTGIPRWGAAILNLLIPGTGHLGQRRYSAGTIWILLTIIFWDWKTVLLFFRAISVISALSYDEDERA